MAFDLLILRVHTKPYNNFKQDQAGQATIASGNRALRKNNNKIEIKIKINKTSAQTKQQLTKCVKNKKK